MFFGIDLVKDRKTREPHTAAAAHILAKLKEVSVKFEISKNYSKILWRQCCQMAESEIKSKFYLLISYFWVINCWLKWGVFLDENLAPI